MAANQHESALLGHFQRVEDALLAQSKVAASSGHSVLQGTAREAFVREFLESHLAERLGVGTGEVISADSKIDDERNQLDVLVYSRGYPKLYIGGSVSLFLIEAVLAVLEVKTTLDKEELKTAIRTARRLKTLPRNLRPTTSEIADWEPPLLYYVVAYGGYKTLAGIHKAILEIHDEEHIVVPAPVAWKGDAPDALGAYKKERITRKNPSIDGVILLGKGYVQFDNANAWFLPDAPHLHEPSTSRRHTLTLAVGPSRISGRCWRAR